MLQIAAFVWVPISFANNSTVTMILSSVTMTTTKAAFNNYKSRIKIKTIQFCVTLLSLHAFKLRRNTDRSTTVVDNMTQNLDKRVFCITTTHTLQVKSIKINPKIFTFWRKLRAKTDWFGLCMRPDLKRWKQNPSVYIRFTHTRVATETSEPPSPPLKQHRKDAYELMTCINSW